MAIELVKRGGSVELLKKDPTLEVLNVCLGWETNKYDGRHDFDLDVTVFAVNEHGKCRDDRDMIFYNNTKHDSGSIIHSGDERSGAKNGDDEIIEIDLAKVPSDIQKIVGVITIYDAKNRNQNFGQVSKAYCRLDNKKSGEQLFKYDLSEEFGLQTAVKVFEVYRYNGQWKFKAVGDGYEAGLAEFVEEFGLGVKGDRK